MSDGGGADRITAAAIARRLGLGRAAVTNWRRRYPDFPAPVADGSSPLFAWADVERWLVATGKGAQLAVYGQTDTGSQLLHRRTQQSDGDITTLMPGQVVARVIASLLPPLDEEIDLPVVLDPQCGAGERLVAVAERFDHGVALVGYDDDEGRVESARSILRQHPSVGASVVETSLPRERTAAVVCLAGDEPPSGSASGSTDSGSTWALWCLAWLRPHGTAVVAVPASAATRSSGRSVRADLVRRGALDLVVGLPSISGAPALHVWVLRQTPQRGEDVRMVDVSAVADPADLPTSREAWDRLVDDADPALVRQVPRIALLDGVADLDPTHHVGADPATTARGLADLTARLRALYEQVGAVLHAPVAAGTRDARDLVALAELELRGAVTVMPRESSPHAGDVVLRGRGQVPTVAEDHDDGVGVAQVVAISTEHLDAHFVALFLRPEVAALPAATLHGGPSRSDLRRCRLPHLPLSEQRRYGDAYRRLLDLEQFTSRLARTTTAVLDETVHGLTTGAVRPVGAARPLNEGEPA